MLKLENEAGSSHRVCAWFRALVLVVLSPNVYCDPEGIAKILARYTEVESVDIVARKEL